MTPATGRDQAEAGPDPGSVESLYPFIYAGSTATRDALDQACRSTTAKLHEIGELRDSVSKASGAEIEACARDMAARFAAGGRLLAFGNGGSATDAQQMATLFLYPGPDLAPLPAISLASDVAVLTSLANDVGVEVMFARQVAAFGRGTDIAVGLSTSGNSENLLRAFGAASHRGLLTVGISGYDGGKMAELDCLDYLFVAPSTSIHRIQEAQTTIYQVLWELTVAELAGQRVAI
jgi:D-sedoheptulose 7-phosphate isomerase